ncbi:MULTISPECIES: RloB domain-containing protein [Bacillus cereus group]|uniref:RloB domain-containing protein n=1 Tax=Bacillus cereus group TaxID=86661 RepID=UPI0001A02D5F|nr:MULTISPECIES: RloB domain-containing protein [Bacillus cereus group]EEK64299.1 Abortive phage resistance protein [Bacillus wiedmannii]MDA2666563.1 RloB domain-containing protein [Bacillus cereus group sp. Bc032]MDA2677253.1 RloB domain-containing protein [Bacillus cereus group sp. Bc031]MDA2682771.1 RloB domain-containing protein [Bacillus cereus group sp. Bc029]MDA2688218.1 RloB domain-containing protein [Bacillus cereus group sp. Bc030]
MSFRLSSKSPNQSRLISESQKEDGKKKYFFVLEGEKTEHIYMNEVANNIKEDSLIDVLILERISNQQSNQHKITVAIRDFLDGHSKIDPSIKSQLYDLCNKYEEEVLDETQLLDSINELLEDMKDDFITKYNDTVIEQIRLLHNLESYSKGLDKICLILDRDYKSFKENQYDEVLKICEENEFLLGITNPNIEFYLLLHMNDAKQYDAAQLLENRRTAKSKTSKKFVESELNKTLKVFGKSYSKTNFDAKFFVDRFPDFLKNIEGYETDNARLKTGLGSSVHQIIKQIL